MVARRDDRWAARGIVALVLVLNAYALAPEIDIGRVNLNDTVFHHTIIHHMIQRLDAGQSPLDFWMPEWSFGYPVVRDYQPFGHWIVVAAHYLSGRQFPLDGLFSFVRYLLLVLFPLSAYFACRAMSMRAMTSAAVAMLSPLIASPNLFGIEFGSYLWRGNGLYTQLVAMHFFVLAIGFGWKAIRSGRAVSIAGLLLALTFVSHFIYGYMAAATLILIAALPDADVGFARRFVRLAWTGVLSFLIAAFQIVPMLADGPYINRSRWEPAWKWDSFGFSEVFGLTATGDLLDANRLPILSLLALLGTITFFKRRKDDEPPHVRLFAIAGAVLWLFLFCGRASWGPLFKTIGLTDAAQLHRFIGGAQWFLLLLAGLGLARLWELPRHRIVAVVLTIALLAIPVKERLDFLSEGRAWGRQNLAYFEAQRSDIEQTIAAARKLGGRAYPGLAAAWGAQFRVGYVPFYAFLSTAHVPAVAFLYHSMALPADVMVRFAEQRPEQYRLFDVRSAIAETTRPMPAFLTPGATFGGFRVLRAPSSSAFDVVTAPMAVYVDRRTFYDINDAWLQSGWVASRAHLLLDYESAIPTPLRPRSADLSALTMTPAQSTCGSVIASSDYKAHVNVAGNDCFALFKTTYHPNWRAFVDGQPRATVMLSPGFVGVPLRYGRHTVEMRYQAGVLKPILLALALPFFFCSFFVERRGVLQRIEERTESVRLAWNGDVAFAALALVLILPVLMPYVSRAQPNGHDALEYLPRVTEFHENIRHGILLPRWAPDLSSGQGQPLLLLNPPLFYYITEAFHLAGFTFVGAMNGACVLLILAAAAAMFVLGRWYFGAAGAAIATVAYVYAPYFLVDLYVRTAFAEFAAFPFYPLAIYGFARHAESRNRRFLLLGSVAYAATWFAHTPAALLFSPLLGAFILFVSWRARDLRVLGVQVLAAAFGMLIAASFWMPSLVESRDTHAERLTIGPLHYALHFVTPHQFFANTWGYGVSIPGDQDGMPFNLGWAHLAIGAIAVIFIARRADARWKRWAWFFALSAFVQCYLMTERAHPIWRAIPHLHYVAFPWRLLGPTTFCIALIVGAIVLALRELPATWRTIANIAVFAALILPALPHAQPASYLSLDPTLWTPQQIAARGAVAGTFETFESRWIVERPVYNGGVIDVNRGTATARVLDRGPVHLDATVTATTEAELALPITHFPGWNVTVDGAEGVVDSPSPSGRIRVVVPPGTHRIEADFDRTPVRWAADLTSSFALLLMLVAAARMRRRSAAGQY